MKAILFDRDGIIIDSEYAHIKAVEESFKKLNITITKNDKKLIVARHPNDYIPDFKKKYKFSSEQFLEEESKLYYKYFNEVPIFNETIKSIKKLKEENYKIGLTTSSGINSTRELFKRIEDLEKYFDVIVTREQYTKSKPNPEPYLLTAKKLDVKPNECIVVEDSSTGLIAAKSAGMKCIVIPTELTKEQDFSKADLIIDSGKKLTRELIEKLFKK
jgi:HAD superfamily hydrolase (TIGR01509 family)